MNNVQTFFIGSDQYAQSRPQYPDELFSTLSGLCASHDRAWDCATGNGQAAVSCAKYFSQVEATDLSEAQIRHGIAHPQVRYSVSPAEQTHFEAEAFDLVTVAQAVHWFDKDKFFQEADRVLKPKGVLAIWGYAFFEIEPEIDRLVAEKLLAPIDQFWAEGNREITSGYRALSLPFEPLETQRNFSIHVEWNLAQTLAYFRTWSAVKRYKAELGRDPVERIEKDVREAWGDAETTRPVRMPLFVKASRKV
ncbi:MAG: class I SAM-dependent methyltransferase [Anaerolineales bacterium]|nr:class I SAM-dependent methyltransferase [Anaerolineales bacterium]